MNTEYLNNEDLGTGVISNAIYNIEGLAYADLATASAAIPTGAIARVTGTIPQATVTNAPNSPNAVVTVTATLNAFN